MNHYLSFGWGNGDTIEVILSPGLRVVGQVWDQIGTSEKIQDEESVGGNFIPKVHWIRRIKFWIYSVSLMVTNWP